MIVRVVPLILALSLCCVCGCVTAAEQPESSLSGGDAHDLPRRDYAELAASTSQRNVVVRYPAAPRVSDDSVGLRAYGGGGGAPPGRSRDPKRRVVVRNRRPTVAPGEDVRIHIVEEVTSETDGALLRRRVRVLRPPRPATAPRDDSAMPLRGGETPVAVDGPPVRRAVVVKYPKAPVTPEEGTQRDD
ncbi:hypothetical protein DQ04_06141040 [Trypanosoma grayi]|uniref:hypothetical protein n=1 Tax=Trypanosoma grayi TaxID=71804 RepID=UPI0004F41F50|nr:hypothetical protein DQ04_06141040 [Trypanosoma grayi]KEG08941.1 hypothetical protein DQ04_06141040 [Trypanosoma grayi]